MKITSEDRENTRDREGKACAEPRKEMMDRTRAGRDGEKRKDSRWILEAN